MTSDKALIASAVEQVKDELWSRLLEVVITFHLLYVFQRNSRGGEPRRQKQNRLKFRILGNDTGGVITLVAAGEFGVRAVTIPWTVTTMAENMTLLKKKKTIIILIQVN